MKSNLPGFFFLIIFYYDKLEDKDVSITPNIIMRKLFI